MSELFDKQVDAQKEINFWGSHKPTKKCDENETKKQRRKKRRVCKNVIDGKKHFIGRLQKTGENNWDKLWVNNCGHNEGIICLVSG